ncbi:hypothetical protein CAL7716_053450 [Calothrix sp. PCC 7716]|nr:hypothetical protein CAL7716_053450 [Calothrix sp. PCC 7716]
MNNSTKETVTNIIAEDTAVVNNNFDIVLGDTPALLVSATNIIPQNDTFCTLDVHTKDTPTIDGDVSAEKTPIRWYPKNDWHKDKQYSEDEDINYTINKALSYGLTPLPVAPALDPYSEGGHEVERGNPAKKTYDRCPLKDGKPKAKFSGKNPSCMRNSGKQYNISHRQYHNSTPTDKQLKEWFQCVYNGVGIIGNYEVLPLDFDAKDFNSQEECDDWFFNDFIAKNGFEDIWQEKSGGGGYRVVIAVEEYPNFGTMARTPGGELIGEIRGYGCFAVMAPTIHPNGNSYRLLVDGGIPIVKNLESIGIYPSGNEQKEDSPTKTKQQHQIDSNGEYVKTSSKRNKAAGFGQSSENELVNFFNNKVLPELQPEDIYNWDGHNFEWYGETLQGMPYGRSSSSGTSFHVNLVNGQWLWIDRVGFGGGAIEYRWMLKGGSGTPTGKDYVDIVRELASQAGVEMPAYTPKIDSKKVVVDNDLYNSLTSIDVGLCSKLGIKVKRINKEFLTDSDLGLQPHKVSIVVSPKGTAKTKSLVSAIANTQFEGIASWHTRISLCMKMAAEINIKFKPEHPSKKQSFCSNSAPKFNPRNLLSKGLLIGDEFDQIMQYNFESLCNKDGMRPTILRYFEAHLHAALSDGSALFMSEDIAQKEIDIIHSLVPPGTEIEVVINEFQPTRGNLLFSTDSDCTGLLKVLLEKIDAGVPCFVVDDLKDGVMGGKSIAQYLSEQRPELNLKIINSETSAKEAEFISNINELSTNVELIVCSPSITAGVSLENQRFNDGVFLFCNGIFDANAASQALGRVRGAKQIYVWCAEQGFNYEQSHKYTPEDVNDYYQEIETKRASIIQNFNPNYDILSGEFTSPYWKLFCKNAAVKNIAMADLRNKVKAKLIKDGYQLEETKFITNTATSEATKKDLDNAWGTLKLEKLKKIATAELPTEDKLKAISKKLDSQETLTELEQVQLIKHQLHKTFGEKIISKSTSEFNGEKLEGYASLAYLNWDGSLEKSCYKYYNCFMQELKASVDRDLWINNAQSYLGSRFPGDIKFSMIDAERTKRLNLKQFLDPNKQFFDADCEKIHAALVEEHKNEPKHWIHKTKPAATVAKLLRERGLEFKTTANGKAPQKKVNGKLVRYYQVEQASLDFLNNFAEHQFSKLAQTESAIAIEGTLDDSSAYFAVDSDEPDFKPTFAQESLEYAHRKADALILELANPVQLSTDTPEVVAEEVPKEPTVTQLSLI